MIVSVERREWLWLIFWTGIIVLLVSLPHLYAASLSSSANHYSGFIIGVEDGNSYLAKMHQGLAGNWLFSLTYTSEEYPRALFFIHYIALGHFARWFNVDLHLMLRLAWLSGIIFELISFYCFTAFFTVSVSVRRIAFLLFSLTAGFGWLWLLLGLPATLGQMPVDLWVPDTSFFLSALASPHLGLVHGLMLWFIVGSLAFLDQKRFSFWLLAAGAGLLASLIQPYKLIVPGVLLGLFWLWRVYRYRQSFWQGVSRLSLVALPSVPYLIYALIVFETNPAFQSWRTQSPNLTPWPLYLLLGLGLLLPLMLVGMWQLRLCIFQAQRLSGNMARACANTNLFAHPGAATLFARLSGSTDDCGRVGIGISGWSDTALAYSGVGRHGADHGVDESLVVDRSVSNGLVAAATGFSAGQSDSSF